MTASLEALDTFDSDRRFQIWRYGVSHSQLLLRSNREDKYETRVEVLFKGVRRVDLPTLLDQLHIRHDGERFSAQGNGWRGSVEAVVLFSIEDAGAYYDPSLLFIDGL